MNLFVSWFLVMYIHFSCVLQMGICNEETSQHSSAGKAWTGPAQREVLNYTEHIHLCIILFCNTLHIDVNISECVT